MKRIFFTLLLTTALAAPVASHAETYQTNRSGFDFPFFDFGGGNRTMTTNSMARIDHSRLDPSLIQAIQQELTDNGFYKGGVDGIWDPATEMALAGFQGSEGLRPTGLLDEETLAHMSLVMQASDQIASETRPLASTPGTVYVVTREVPRTTRTTIITGAEYAGLNRSEVMAVQRSLARNGYYTAKVDGIWGPKTAKGVRDFQVANNIPVTGRLTNQTIAGLGLEVHTISPDVTRIEPAAGGW